MVVEVAGIINELESHRRQMAMLDRNKGDIRRVCFFTPKYPYLVTQGNYLTFHTEAYYVIIPNEQPRLYHLGIPLLGPTHPFYLKYSDLTVDENGRPILQLAIGNDAVYKRIKGDIELNAHLKDFRSWGIIRNLLAPLDN